MMEKQKRAADAERKWFSLQWLGLPVMGTISGLTCMARSCDY